MPAARLVRLGATPDFHHGLLGLSAAALAFVALSSVAAPLTAAPDVRLVEAVQATDAAAVRRLLQTKANVNAAQPDGMTPLHWAVLRNDLTIADLLLRAGADARALNRYGVRPLSVAALNGNAAMIHRLLQAGADVNAATPGGETALMAAARSGVPEAVTALLAKGADIHAKETRRGHSALVWAAANNRAAVVRALVAAGADVRARTAGGFTPLLFAIREGATEAVEALFAAGADHDDRMPDGTSALMLAIINGRMDLALRLLDHGANPNVPDPRGSPLHAIAWVRKPGYPQNTAALLHLAPPEPDTFAVAESLLKHGANPNVRIQWPEIRFDVDLGIVQAPPNIMVARNYLTFNGATAFWLAAKHSDVPLMRLLVTHGADPRLATVQNVTPLMVAAGLGFWDAESPAPQNGTPESDTLEAVKMAFELGGDVHAVTQFGDLHLEGDGPTLRRRHPVNLASFPESALGDMRWGGATALHGAAVRGVSSVVQFLVDKGANLQAKTVLGWTPLMMAEGVFVANAERQQAETEQFIRRLLKERGLPAE